jgi:hypothetical protein
VNPVVVPDTVRRVGVPDSAAIRNRREAIQKKQLIDPN